MTTFEGTPGNDRGNFGYSHMFGRDGNDELQMNVAGYGEVHGEAGDDIVYMHPYTSGTYGSVYGGDGNDMGIGGFLEDEVYGDGGNDRVDGHEGDDRVYGGGGRDAVHGGKGDDILYGGRGSDAGTIVVPTSSNLTGPPNYSESPAGIFGGEGRDRLYGGNGRDALDGGADDDILVGGKGGDWLTGGEGNDTFRFKSKDSKGGKAGRDTILDFSEGDVIDLSPIDAVKGKPGNQAFDYIGRKAFSGEAGELRYKKGKLSADTDGDARADFVVKLEGAPHLQGADFLL